MAIKNKLPLYSVVSAVLVCFLIWNAPSKATTIVTVQGPESPTDKRYEYDRAVIELALIKTRAKYGEFVLQETSIGQNSRRALLDAANNKYANYIIKYSMHSDLPDTLSAIPFPVDLGIVGYRVAFVSNKTKAELAKVKTLEDLKQFEIIQGLGWLDTRILEHHGFKVRTAAEYHSMFSMVALNRSDLFLRGANELLEEWKTHRTIPQLTYDEAVSIYYPLPRFLVTSSENEDLLRRVHEGLLKAYEDGSLLELWDEKYGASIDFAKLNTRKVFHLSNPYIEGLDPSWQKYIYQVGAELTQ
ncbi:hypothetical protein ABVF61_01035 [Roseibium sp. HPY-6]|uniref:hypothetical protein n=1 Tax=Roseibium sp. HPY-6 TaxID=3229852 RepID=UPI00338DA2BC